MYNWEKKSILVILFSERKEGIISNDFGFKFFGLIIYFPEFYNMRRKFRLQEEEECRPYLGPHT